VCPAPLKPDCREWTLRPCPPSYASTTSPDAAICSEDLDRPCTGGWPTVAGRANEEQSAVTAPSAREARPEPPPGFDPERRGPERVESLRTKGARLLARAHETRKRRSHMPRSFFARSRGRSRFEHGNKPKKPRATFTRDLLQMEGGDVPPEGWRKKRSRGEPGRGQRGRPASVRARIHRGGEVEPCSGRLGVRRLLRCTWAQRRVELVRLI